MVQLLRLAKHKQLDSIGQKASSIHWLIKKYEAVPVSYVLTYESYHEFLADRSRLQQELERQLIDNFDWEAEYAMMSSANVD